MSAGSFDGAFHPQRPQGEQKNGDLERHPLMFSHVHTLGWGRPAAGNQIALTGVGSNRGPVGRSDKPIGHHGMQNGERVPFDPLGHR